MASHIGRRKFLATLLGGAAAAWPLAARAQQAAKVPTIGLLGGDASAWTPWVASFTARLRELGWIEGRNIAIEYRWSEGRSERIAEVAAEFTRLNVNIIVTNDTSAPAVKQATSVIPIVFVLGNDPVGTGLVASLARPGGNVTGLSVQQPSLPANVLTSCARLCLVSVGWRSWPMSAVPPRRGLCVRLRPRLVRSASMSRHSKSGAPKTLRPPLRHSMAEQTHFTSCKKRWLSPIVHAS